MFLKKFISYWLMPLPFCLALLVLGWWRLRSPGGVRSGRRLVGAALLLLLLFGNKTVSTWLVWPLESRYPACREFVPGQAIPADLAACRYVVVLGAGNGNVPGLPATSELVDSSIARLVEAVRILRVLPRADLIVSGPGLPPHPSHAQVLANAAVSLGIDRARIHLIDYAHDTEEESRAVRALAGDARVALVTTAWHMPRAMENFRRAGVNTLPCPANYISRPQPEFHWDDLNWDVESLNRSTAAVHERLGLLWLWLKTRSI